MPSYWYRLRKRTDREPYARECISVPDISDVVPYVLKELLVELRYERYRGLPSPLPKLYMGYTVEQLKEHMASLYEVAQMYVVYDIELASDRQGYQCCQGCIENQPNQLAHMACPSGCLHDKDTCSITCD